MTYFAGVRAVTPVTPVTNWERLLMQDARSTRRAQIRRRDDDGQWFVAIPFAGLYSINPTFAIRDRYIADAIGLRSNMTAAEIAMRVGARHAQHVAWASTVRSDQNGIGITRRESIA